MRSNVKQKAQHVTQGVILPAQSRGARGMIGWNQAQLADAAKVSRMTVMDFERGEPACLTQTTFLRSEPPLKRPASSSPMEMRQVSD